MHNSSLKDRRKEVVFFGPENTRSLESLLPISLFTQIKRLWNSEEKYLLFLGERKLLKEAHKRGKYFAIEDYQIRARFWVEFDRIQDDKHVYDFSMAWVIGRSAIKEVFYEQMIRDPIKLTFLLTPPQDYADMIEIALNTAIIRLADFLDQVPLDTTNPQINMVIVDKYVKALDIISKRFAMTKFKRKSRTDEAREPDETPANESEEETLARTKEELADAD